MLPEQEILSWEIMNWSISVVIQLLYRKLDTYVYLRVKQPLNIAFGRNISIVYFLNEVMAEFKRGMYSI